MPAPALLAPLTSQAPPGPTADIEGQWVREEGSLNRTNEPGTLGDGGNGPQYDDSLAIINKQQHGNEDYNGLGRDNLLRNEIRHGSAVKLGTKLEIPQLNLYEEVKDNIADEDEQDKLMIFAKQKQGEDYREFIVETQHVNATLFPNPELGTGKNFPQTLGTQNIPPPCPTLARCLGYAACVFNFGNEFCRGDPLPGRRKLLDVNVTCLRKELVLMAPPSPPAGDGALQLRLSHAEVVRRQSHIVNLAYVSYADFGVPDYERTNVTSYETNLLQVEGARCDVAEGYRGQCGGREPSSRHVVDSVWHLMARSRDAGCRLQLLQTFCAYQFSPAGLCVPPFALAPQQLQQLQLLYSPAHVFLYHVDTRRQQLRQTLQEAFTAHYPAATNIKILPQEESFVPSWGSYGIVRAELQGLRYLLDLPHWEFVIKLSGADLPLRSPQDLGLLLAPYRGRSLATFFRVKNFSPSATSLQMDVWHGCGGHVYNVTRAAGPPATSDVEVLSGSQWSVPHRSLVQYLFSANRSAALRRHHFYFSTSILPDEMFTATVLQNSPLRNRTLNVSLHWLKAYQKRSALQLCRHTHEADFCGQGPSTIESSDWPALREASHRYFFARKFNTSFNSSSSSTLPPATEATRDKVAHHQRQGYYEDILRHVSHSLIRQMVRMSLDKLILQGQLDKTLLWDGSADYKLRFLPQLESPHPCCDLPYQLGYKMVQHFSAVLDFSLPLSDGKILRARSRIIPQKMFACYPDGHLRALRVTTWPANALSLRHLDSEGAVPPQSSVNLPLSSRPAPVTNIYVELWLHVTTRSVNEECARRRVTAAGAPLHLLQLNMTAVTAAPLRYQVAVQDYTQTTLSVKSNSR
ncbi:uncharacterized protein LOC108679286 [Hyalella azteca]|uniref:protein xylosyltransferase n=1 Tax=Hyalella azteca TaxID=294128 RepID=A0A979FUN9_HYAAZ|nr:uncharacterized protein LOC108679286 [Hyalella azteca]